MFNIISVSLESIKDYDEFLRQKWKIENEMANH